LAHSTLEGTKVISIDGLQALVDRLSRLDVGRTETDALEHGARDLKADADAINSTSVAESEPERRGCESGASAGLSYRINDHSVIIGTTDSAAIAREVGGVANQPDPSLSVAAQQSGLIIAERIGQMFAQLVAGIRND
jgi:hypothetical protein